MVIGVKGVKGLRIVGWGCVWLAGNSTATGQKFVSLKAIVNCCQLLLAINHQSAAILLDKFLLLLLLSLLLLLLSLLLLLLKYEKRTDRNTNVYCLCTHRSGLHLVFCHNHMHATCGSYLIRRIKCNTAGIQLPK